jgi:inositol phosphorylceramide mannosyltransferase catalytic subunit
VAVLGRMGNDTTFEHSIPNAWMAASPGHPFFLMPLAAARSEIAKSRSVLQSMWYDFPSAARMTGPIALRKAVARFENSGLNREATALAQMGPFSKRKKNGLKDEVVLLPGHWVYPYNWNEGPEFREVCSTEEETFDAERCRELLQVDQRGSVSITYWSHTRQEPRMDARDVEHVDDGMGVNDGEGS